MFNFEYFGFYPGYVTLHSKEGHDGAVIIGTNFSKHTLPKVPLGIDHTECDHSRLRSTYSTGMTRSTPAIASTSAHSALATRRTLTTGSSELATSLPSPTLPMSSIVLSTVALASSINRSAQAKPRLSLIINPRPNKRETRDYFLFIKHRTLKRRN